MTNFNSPNIRYINLLYLFLKVDCTGHFIGDNIAFLFPDLKTALVGTFVKGAMVMAQTCFIQLVAVRNEVCQLKFTQPR